MRGSRNFRQGGGPGQSDKKSYDKVFFFFVFFCPQLSGVNGFFYTLSHLYLHGENKGR